jgi:hypothetical protein
VDATDGIALGVVAYLGASFGLHRARLSRLHGDGLELVILRRLDGAALPSTLQPVLEAFARAEAARARNDRGGRESAAAEALAAISRAGGARASLALRYLDAQLRLSHLTGPFTLELVGLGVLVGLKRAVRRLGHQPELYQAIAHAHALLGQSNAALDALARAAFYANGRPFYAALVLDSEFVEKQRPRLRQQLLESRPPDAP